MFKIALCYDDGAEIEKYFAQFADIKGMDGEFIVEKDIYQLTLLNGFLDSGFHQQLNNGLTELPENIYMVLLGKDDNVVGRLFLANVKIIDVTLEPKDVAHIVINAYMSSSRPGRYKSWKMKLSGEIDQKNKWSTLKSSERQGWLDMAVQCSENYKGKGRHIVIDGSIIDDRDSFYCALGEAINGAGGYFGRNLDALDDCLSGGFGPVPQSVMWKNAKLSQSKMIDFYQFITILTEIFTENSIDFILDRT